MERVKVESSNIASVGYDKDRREMIVEFKTGTFYSYKDVPSLVYRSFLEAKSKGKFFNINIKTAFLCSKLTKEEEEKKEENKKEAVPKFPVVDTHEQEETIEEDGDPMTMLWKEIDNLTRKVAVNETEISILREKIKRIEAVERQGQKPVGLGSYKGGRMT
jgi:hypothetical protein